MDKEYREYIKKLFNTWAPFYDLAVIFLSGVREKVVKRTKAPKASKILDVATGTGKQAFAFAKKGYEVTGIDFSENMLRKANKKNKYSNVKFKLADASNLDFEDACFDMSCVSFALHDMPLQIREKVLNEMVRLTKPKGIVVIVDYALPKNRIGGFLVYQLIRSYESKYYKGFIRSDLNELIRNAGIKIKDEYPVLCGAGRILIGTKFGEGHHLHLQD